MSKFRYRITKRRRTCTIPKISKFIYFFFHNKKKKNIIFVTISILLQFRKMLTISPDTIAPGIVRSLISLGDGGVEDGDRMLRACLSTLCEFGVLNPTLLIMCGGVSVITRNVLECHSPRIAESLCGVLLHLLDCPQTRNIAGISLDCLAAPYCDFTYRLGIMDKNK